jgi:glycosyltransferase involved in cell wall biosynthesis
MRIVTVLTSLGMGGAEKLALAVAERMARHGHDVALLSLMPRLREQWPTTLPVTYLGVRKNPASVAAGFRRGRKFLRKFRPDLVHSHSFHANILARLLPIGLLGVPRAVVISSVHNVYEGGRMRMLGYRLTDPWSARTVAISQAAAERFVRLKAVPERKCSVRGHGIDTQVFAPDARRRALTREAKGADSSFVWLCAGRIAPAKDYPNLLRAFAIVEQRHSDTQLWIAGGGSEGACKELESLANDLRVREKVFFLGLQRDMPSLLDAADGFVLGSAWEGLPQVIAEAMAMEKPVVATDVGGVRELMGDPSARPPGRLVAGTLVPAKDVEALAAAMVATMRRDRDERALEGEAARELIVRRFSIDAVADGWEELYEQEIASS